MRLTTIGVYPLIKMPKKKFNFFHKSFSTQINYRIKSKIKKKRFSLYVCIGKAKALTDSHLRKTKS